MPIVNIPYTQHNLEALQGAMKAGTRIICDGKEHFVKALTMRPLGAFDIVMHLEPVVYPVVAIEKEDAPKKPVGEEYSNDRFSGGWDCSDEEYNYSAYVRDVLNAGWWVKMYQIERCGNCIHYRNGECRLFPEKNVHPTMKKCIWYGPLSSLRVFEKDEW